MKDIRKENSMKEIAEKIEYIDISILKKSNKNPRKIKNRAFYRLIESIKKDPKFLELRPILVDENYEIYAGNQRYAACLMLNWKEVPIVKTIGLTEEQKKERMLRDNLHAGEFDFQILKDDFDNDMVKDVFDDPDVFSSLEEKEEEKAFTESKLVEQMELKNFESHDYIVFAFNDIRDYLFVLQKMGIGKVDGSLSPKTKKIGIGRVVDGKSLARLLSN